MKRMAVSTLILGVWLSGCATTSFSPPSVNLENETEVRGSNYSFGQRCMPNERKVNNAVVPINETATGAQKLIDNFIFMYRCRAHSAANGRQAFEVPALLTGLGTATALAFGASSEVAIAGGAATAGFNSGKNYYDPKAKAAIYQNALDAVICIKTEASNSDPKTLIALSSLETGGQEGRKLIGDATTMTAERRFFSLVQANLFSVERVLAQRLSNVGSFDPAGVVAEIKTLSEEARQKADSAKSSAANQANALVEDGKKANSLDTAKAAAAVSDATKIAEAIVQLETLQTRLQQCVVRAKI